MDDISPSMSVLPRLLIYLRAMRPHQWSKNLLIFAPLAASHDFSHVREALIALVAFSLVASSVYIINDLIDLESDRRHPRKRNRPFASGLLGVAEGAGIATGLLVTAIAVAMLFTPKPFVAVLATYFVFTCAYSTYLKRKLLVDVVTLAGLYTMRIAAGSAATGIAFSPWLLVFSMFLFCSLAIIKRQAELIDQFGVQKVIPGRAYVAADLPVLRAMAVASGQAAVLVLALYVNSLAASQLYAAPEVLWIACVVLFYWLSRMEVLTERGFMHDDPIVFAARDRISLAAAALVFVIAALAVKGW